MEYPAVLAAIQAFRTFGFVVGGVFGQCLDPNYEELIMEFARNYLEIVFLTNYVDNLTFNVSLKGMHF